VASLDRGASRYVRSPHKSSTIASPRRPVAGRLSGPRLRLSVRAPFAFGSGLPDEEGQVAKQENEEGAGVELGKVS